MVFWEEDARFQPAQLVAQDNGNEFVRRTYDVDGLLDFPKALLSAIGFLIENADDLLDDEQLAIAEEQQHSYQKLAV